MMLMLSRTGLGIWAHMNLDGGGTENKCKLERDKNESRQRDRGASRGENQLSEVLTQTWLS